MATSRPKRALDMQITVRRVTPTDPMQLAAASDRWFRSFAMLLALQERLEKQKIEADQVSCIQNNALEA